MIVDYISDLHIDFYLSYDNYDIDNLKTTILHDIFSKKTGEVLIIAGDLGHYNEQNIFLLKTLCEYYGYKKIFFVLGNHDYYLLQDSMQKTYNNSSFKKIHEMKKLCAKFDNIHLLSGDTIEYKGVVFGGCAMWYDGKYMQRLDVSMNKEKINDLWTRKVLDARMIYGIKRFDSLYLKELEKLKQFYDKSDVIITHINPSILPEHTPKKHVLDKINGFYSFDGEYYVQNTKAKYWVFGHTHTRLKYHINNTTVLSNPLGYPNENEDISLLNFKL